MRLRAVDGSERVAPLDLGAPVRSRRAPRPSAAARAPLPAVQPTVSQLLHLYLSTRSPLKAGSTQRNDRLYARLVAAAWAEISVAEISPAHVDDLLQDVAARGPALANRVRSFLSQAFKLAERRGWRPANSNPTTSAEHFREVVLTEFLSLAERRAVLEAVHACAARRTITPAAGTLILLMLLGGLRWSEARELRWSEVDLERGTLRYHPRDAGPGPALRRRGETRTANKGGDQRSVPISDDLVAVLRAAPRTGPHVAVNPRTRRPYVDLRVPFGRVADAAGLDAVRCHMLRHSFGTALAERDLTAAQIGACLGHRGPSTAHRYIHLVGAAARRALLRAAPAVRGEDVP